MKKFFKFGANKNKGSNVSVVDRRASNLSGSIASSQCTEASLSTSGSSSSSAFGLNLTGSSTGSPDALVGGYDIFPSHDKLFNKLHKAAWTGNLDKIKKYVKKYDLNDVDSELRTPLHLAAAQAHKDVIWFLLGCKAKPNLPDRDGNTPLLKAVTCQHTDIVHFLLDRGSSPKAADGNGNTALHLAAQHGLQDIALALIQKGALLDAVNSGGHTPLLVATASRQNEMIELLLRHGALVDASDKNKRTGLMLACEEGHVGFVRLFLKYGANVDASSSLGLTALDFARVADHEDCLRLIQAVRERKSSTVARVDDDSVPGTRASLKPVTGDEGDLGCASHHNLQADLDDAELDSWGDDDISIDVLPVKTPGFGLNLSKFLAESDKSVSEKSDAVNPFGQSHSKKCDAAAIVSVEIQSKATEASPLSPPAKPKRLPEPTIAGSVGVSQTEPVNGPPTSDDKPSTNPELKVELLVDQKCPKEAGQVVDDEARAKWTRDLMAELGLSDVSELSSILPSSTPTHKGHGEPSGEDTDFDQDLADDDPPQSVGDGVDATGGTAAACHVLRPTGNRPHSVSVEKMGEESHSWIAAKHLEHDTNRDTHNNVVGRCVVMGDVKYVDKPNSATPGLSRLLPTGSAMFLDLKLPDKSSEHLPSDSEDSDLDVYGTIHIRPVGLKSGTAEKRGLANASSVPRAAAKLSSEIDDRALSEQNSSVWKDCSDGKMDDGAATENVVKKWLTDRVETHSCAGTLGRPGTMHGVEEIWEQNPCVQAPQGAENGAADSSSCKGEVYHAEVAHVVSKEDLILCSGAVMQKLTDMPTDRSDWGRLWLQVCGRPLEESQESDSNEDSSVVARLADDESSREVRALGGILGVQEQSSAEECSSLSVQDDQTYKLLTSLLKCPDNTYRMVDMIQYLRRAWQREQMRTKVLSEKVAILRDQQRGSQERIETSGSQCVDLQGQVAELKVELDSMRRLLSVEAGEWREAGLQLQQKEKQLESLEAKYVEEVSSRQKAELRARALQLEAENVRLLIGQLEEQRQGELVRVAVKRPLLDAEIQTTKSDVTAEGMESGQNDDDDDKASLHNFLETEISSYKEQLADMQSSVQTELEKRTAAERKISELEQRMSALSVESVASVQEVEVCRKRMDALSYENGVLIDARDAAQRRTVELETGLQAKDVAHGLLEVELAACRRQMDEIQLQRDLLRQECEMQEAAWKKMEAEVKRKDEENSQLDKELSAARRTLSVTQSECGALKLELQKSAGADAAWQETDLNVQAKWKSILQNAQQEFNAIEKILTDRNSGLVENVNRLQGDLELARGRIAELEGDLCAARSSYVQLTSKSELAADEVQRCRRVAEELECTCSTVRSNNEELMRRADESLKREEVMAAELTVVSEKAKALEECLRASEERAVAAEEKAEAVHVLHGRCQAIAERCESLTTELAIARGMLHEKDSAVVDANRKLEEAASQGAESLLKFEDANARLKAAENTIVALEDALESSEKQVGEIKKSPWNLHGSRSDLEFSNPGTDRDDCVGGEFDSEHGSDGETDRPFQNDMQLNRESARYRGAFNTANSAGDRVSTKKNLARKMFVSMKGGAGLPDGLHGDSDSKSERLGRIEKDLRKLRGDISTLFVSGDRPRKSDVSEDAREHVEYLWQSLQEETLRRKESEAQKGDLEDQLAEARALLKHARDLQSVHNRFEEDFGRLALNHQNCVDRTEVELMRQQLETKARLEINQKMEQIKEFLEEQAKSSTRLEQRHNESETELRHEYSTAIQDLHVEVTHLQQHLQEKEARQGALEEQYQRLCELLAAKQRIEAKLASDDRRHRSRKRDSRHYEALGAGKRSRFPHETKSSLDYSRYITPPLEAVVSPSLPTSPIYNNNSNLRDVGVSPSYKLRAALDHSISHHLNSGPMNNVFSPSDRHHSAVDKAASNYLSSLKRNYLF